jgi:hypothetical protein
MVILGKSEEEEKKRYERKQSTYYIYIYIYIQKNARDIWPWFRIDALLFRDYTNEIPSLFQTFKSNTTNSISIII